MKQRVAVIGAGLAGASCATRLLANGFVDHVHIFDKARASGGRMSTRRGEGWECDHGAQYFTTSSPEFSAAVSRWQAAGVCEKWGGAIKVHVNSSWEDLRSPTDRFVGVPKMKSPIEYMLNHPQITVNTTCLVEELRQVGDKGKWDIQCARSDTDSEWVVGESQEELFDTIIVAAPAPQSKKLVSAHSSALSNVAGSAVMNGCWAVMVRFHARLPLPFDGAFINEGPLSWICRNSAKPGRVHDVETWLLHATGKWSEEHIGADSRYVGDALVEELSRVTGLHLPAHEAEWSAHRWLFATTHPNLDVGSAWDGEKNIGLCGDWLDIGKVEGAWRSGVHLADTITRDFD